MAATGHAAAAGQTGRRGYRWRKALSAAWRRHGGGVGLGVADCWAIGWLTAGGGNQMKENGG